MAKSKHVVGDERQWAVQWYDGSMFRGWTEEGARDLYHREREDFVALHRLDPADAGGWQWVEVERRYA